MRRSGVIAVALGLAAGPRALSGEPEVEPPEASDGADAEVAAPTGDAPEIPRPTRDVLDARVVVPWRDTVSGVPVPGAVRPPDVVLRRQQGWLAKALNGAAAEEPDLGPFAAGAEIPEAAVTARDIPSAPPRPEAASDEEIVVWGDRLEEARRAVQRRLEELGYRAGRGRDGRTLWRPEGADNQWKPRVWLDDDGWFTLDTPSVTFHQLQVSDGRITGGAAPMAPAFERSPAVPTVSAAFRTSTRGQRLAAEARVARQLAEVIEELRAAQGDRGLVLRLESLPDELDRLWHGGVGPDGTTYLDRRSRQAALLDLWATRTWTRAGETVRRAIGDYLLGEVAPVAPLPPDLVAEAQARCECVLGGATAEE